MSTRVGWLPRPGIDNPTTEERNWAVFIHMSLFASYIMPLAGIVVPVVLWMAKRNQSQFLDDHGKIAVNWAITSFIYAVLFVALSFILIGIPLVIALGIVDLAFPIFAAVRASEGRVWEYPLNFPFVGRPSR